MKKCTLHIRLSVALVCQAMPLSAAPCHNVMSILNHLALLQPGFTAALALLKQALCRDKSALMMKSMVVPKKGRGRQVLKRPKCKNPPKQKAEKVKYVRIAQNSAQNKRMDQTKWRRSLPELLAATDLGIIRLLQKDKICQNGLGTNALVAPRALYRLCFRDLVGLLTPIVVEPKDVSAMWTLNTCILSLWNIVEARKDRGIVCKHKLACCCWHWTTSTTLPSIASSTSTTRPLRISIGGFTMSARSMWKLMRRKSSLVLMQIGWMWKQMRLPSTGVIWAQLTPPKSKAKAASCGSSGADLWSVGGPRPWSSTAWSQT